MGLSILIWPSSFWGISKADIASVMGSLCSVIAVNSVQSFLCLQAKYICGPEYRLVCMLCRNVQCGLLLKTRMSLF